MSAAEAGRITWSRHERSTNFAWMWHFLLISISSAMNKRALTRGGVGSKSYNHDWNRITRVFGDDVWWFSHTLDDHRVPTVTAAVLVAGRNWSRRFDKVKYWSWFRLVTWGGPDRGRSLNEPVWAQRIWIRLMVLGCTSKSLATAGMRRPASSFPKCASSLFWC